MVRKVYENMYGQGRRIGEKEVVCLCKRGWRKGEKVGIGEVEMDRRKGRRRLMRQEIEDGGGEER